MRTDLWTLMRGGAGGGGAGGGGGRADGPSAKDRRVRRSPPPPPPDPSGPASGEYSDRPSFPSSVVHDSLHLRPDSIAFTPARPSAAGPQGRPRGPAPTADPRPLESPSPSPAADRPSQSTIALPRRSILAPESKQDEEEGADEEEDERTPQRTRSRILSELRPVASPREAVEISTPLVAEPQLPSPPTILLPDEEDGEPESDYYASDATPTAARRRAFDIFASRRVRLQHRWRADLWIYMKNAHPALALATAHRWHPFRKLDRVLVLLVALAATLLVSGIVATRPCCSTETESVPSVPTASVPTLPLSVRSASTSSAAVSCACGLSHTSALVAIAIAAVVPLVILLLEPLVTLYHDAKLFGCAVRVRRGRASAGPTPAASTAPPRPLRTGCCSYRPDGLAARVGRAFVLALLLALAFAVGAVAARLWDADGTLDAHAALVEWLALFSAAAALGLVAFCSALWLAMFSVRWWREGKQDAGQDPSVLVHQWAGPSHEPSPV